MPYSLYIHIPYCTGRCAYCDFHTQGGSAQVPQAYIKALLRDFARLAPRGAGGAPLRPATVYFGGGTPGLLQPRQLAALLEAFNPQPGAEITLETNPGLADEKLAGFFAAGANRLSVGVQTAHGGSLRRLGRRHTAQDARDTLAAARKAGFTSISADIMLALPGYSEAEFDQTLALAEAGGAVHISAYLLKCEPGTPFGDAPPANLPDEDEAARLYLYAAARLEESGFAQYEISNFARPGHAGRHNLNYWDSGEWLGLGAAAHSHLCGKRFAFPPDTAGYIAGAAPRHVGQSDAEDYIMLRLRLRQGLCEAQLRARYGLVLTQRQRGVVAALCRAHLAQKTAGGFALTPRGMLVQTAVLGALLA